MAMAYLELVAMSDQELRDLNNNIVRILRDRQDQKRYQAMLQLRTGDRVQFRDRSYRMIYGRVTHFNRKTVGVVEENNGRQWRVAPSLLNKLDRVPSAP